MSFCSLHPARRDHLADEARDAFATNIDLEPGGSDRDAPYQQLDVASLFSREELRQEGAWCDVELFARLIAERTNFLAPPSIERNILTKISFGSKVGE